LSHAIPRKIRSGIAGRGPRTAPLPPCPASLGETVGAGLRSDLSAARSAMAEVLAKEGNPALPPTGWDCCNAPWTGRCSRTTFFLEKRGAKRWSPPSLAGFEFRHRKNPPGRRIPPWANEWFRLIRLRRAWALRSGTRRVGRAREHRRAVLIALALDDLVPFGKETGFSLLLGALRFLLFRSKESGSTERRLRRVRSGTIGDTLSGLMGYTFGHHALEPSNPMEEIIRFVMLARSDRFTLTDLCEQFGVSRKTGYKHLARYADAGLKGSRLAATVRTAARIAPTLRSKP